jgi:hypothetical protein
MSARPVQQRAPIFTKPAILAEALDTLAGDIQSGDGVANAAIAEAAAHVRLLDRIGRWWDGSGKFDELEELMEQIP